MKFSMCACQAYSGLQQQEPMVVCSLCGLGWPAPCSYHHILLLWFVGKARFVCKTLLQTIHVLISDSKSSLNDPKKTDDPQEDDEEEEDGENEGAGDEEEGGEDEGDEEGEESGQEEEGEEEEEEEDDPPTTRSQARKRRPRKD